jgi:glucose/arabinose dehydrogenase
VSPAPRRRAAASGALVAALLACGLATAAPGAVRTTARMTNPPRGSVAANELRAGFVETVIADSLDSPVSMAIAPDGRVFVCEQVGRLRVIVADRLLPRPFLVVPTRAEIEEGLIGVAFDPAFERNHWLYVCYTALSPRRHNRVSRFTAAGDTAIAASEKVLIELDDLGDHNLVGGALRFGTDGRLYVTTGENGVGPLAQSLGSTAGKLLRIDPDGSIPADNPFVGVTSGHHRAIWARGLRNPFSFDIDPRNGRVFANDVGAGSAEEVDEVVAGGNYGWPMFEGPGGRPPLRQPIHSYRHDAGCAITGASFYVPRTTSFPREWLGRYLFGEYCWNEIRWLDPDHPERTGVFGVTLVPGPVDLRVARDGTLYYLARGNSSPVGGAGTASGLVVRVTHSPLDNPVSRPQAR